MSRQLYQMGGMGIESLSPMQPAMQPAMQSAMYSPLQNNYSGMPMMANGGRMGYQEGNMAMSQPEGIMGAMSGAMPPEAGGMMQPPMQDQMQGQMMQGQMQPQMQGQLGEGDNALLTIIQLLIEQGVPPEQAEELARQILQVFAQGGEPAVEEFANQLEQEEMMSQDRTMMAGGGITGIYPRQGFFVKGVVKAVTGAVKGVASAVKSVAKSPIGKIALTIGATMLLGPGGMAFGSAGLAGSMGVTNAFLAGAINAGAANLLVQGITTGKINPKEALLASALGGASGYLSSGTTGGISPDVGGIPDVYQPQPTTITSNLANTFTPTTPIETGAQFASAVGPGSTIQAGSINPYLNPTIGDRFTQATDYLKTAGTNLMADPVQTIKGGIGSLYDTAKENIVPLALGFGAGAGVRPQAADESDEDYQRYLAERNAQVSQYITQYGGAANVYSPGEFGLYAREKAVDPFEGRSTYAAMGGRIGYEDGSMPMGKPRRNPAGIMELDYRAKGGFVPPIGIKEKADDIPAMLSNNEFVFTADAVRNAGEGNVNKGAQRMYGLMKQLEAGGVV